MPAGTQVAFIGLVLKHARLFVVQIAILSSACSEGSGLLAGPSPLAVQAVAAAPLVVERDLPALTGDWRVIGTTAFRNQDSGNTTAIANCSGSFTITSQEGVHFAGLLETQGSGARADRLCTASGTFNAEIENTDGSVRARLDGNFQNWPRPAVTPGCDVISAGDGVWTGSVTSDALRLQVTDMLRCPANVDGGILDIPMATFERTVSLTFQRR